VTVVEEATVVELRAIILSVIKSFSNMKNVKTVGKAV
jgi:hypothetical protein